MVLTQTQKKQLHQALLQYFVNNQFPKTAEAFSVQSDLSLEGIDPDGKKLENRWKLILNLQKKKDQLQERVKGLEQELAKCSNGNPTTNINLEDLYIPKTPVKFQMRGHKNPITSMAFHPQFIQLATASEDGTIKIWDAEGGEFQRTLKGHTNPVNCVNYDVNGKYIVSSSSDLQIKLWDLNNDYQCCKTFYGHNHNVSFVDFVLQGDLIISCSRDKTIKLWQISTGYCKRTYTGHQAWVRKVVVSKDGKTLASCSDDQSVIIWNIEKQSPINRFFAHQNVIENIMMIEGQHSSQLMNSQFLKNKFTQQTKINALKQLEKEGLNGISNYQQTFVITSSRDKLIRLFAIHSGELLHTFIGHDNWVKGLAIHPTGKYLYSASDDKTIRIWDLNYGKDKKRIEAHEHFISSIHFHKKYGIIATGGNDLIIKIWHLK